MVLQISQFVTENEAILSSDAKKIRPGWITIPKYNFVGRSARREASPTLFWRWRKIARF